jgi:NitT/TauT family transport system ATP-binding protein
VGLTVLLLTEPQLDMTTPTAAVEVLSAGKIFSDGTCALAPITLTIPQGEFGPDRPVRLRQEHAAQADVEPPGAVRRPPHVVARRYDEMASLGHRVAFVFQDPTLIPWARVAVNVRLPLGAVLGTAVIGEPRNAGALFGRTVEDSDRGLFTWAWPLIGIEKFDVTVPALGQQGFWRWTQSPSM